MRLGIKVGAAAILVAAGVTSVMWILAGEGLDRAEKWISIGGVCVSTVISIAGLVVGWMAWREATNDSHGSARVVAAGVGGVGVWGNNGGEIRTDISGVRPAKSSPSGAAAGTHAAGTGSVAVGGDNTAPITTRVTVTGPDSTTRP